MTEHLRNLLATTDEELFRQGACHVFACALVAYVGERGFRLKRVIDEVLAHRHPKYRALHVCLAREDEILDVKGSQSWQQWCAEESEFRCNSGGPAPLYKLVPCTPKELFTPDPDALCPHKGAKNHWGLFIDQEFVAEARVRALAQIEAHRELYNVC